MNDYNIEAKIDKSFAANYCRVSTEELASKDDNSLEVQKIRKLLEAFQKFLF